MCDYQGHEFGANYPDSVCIDGYLWDADSGDADGDGWLYTSGGDMPCPECNRAVWLEHVGEDVREQAAVKGYDFKWPFRLPRLWKNAPHALWWQFAGWFEGAWMRVTGK